MIYIKRPFIEIIEEKYRCICDTYVDNEVHPIWFEVDKKYGKYLCTERADAYVIGLLSWAMRNKHDITCDVSVSEELLYQLNEVVIPELVKHGKSMSMIKINAEAGCSLDQGEGVGTALSCGVDSFWSIQKHLNSAYKGMNLTHVCINNVGAFNSCYAGYGEERVKNERYLMSAKVAEELGLDLIETDSNFAEAYEQEHLLTVSYSNVFAIYMLQKLWRIYYLPSNGIDFAEFSLRNHDENSSERTELFLLQYLSSKYLRIYCDGGELNRLEKLETISKIPYVQKYLHVCIYKPFNCGYCQKCRRTLLALDALNVLDSFRESFDIDYYNSHRQEYYNWIWGQHMNGDLQNEPVYQILSQRNDFHVSNNYKIKQRIVFFAKNHFSDRQKQLIKKMVKK